MAGRAGGAVRKVIFETEDPLRLLDTETGVWRVAVRDGSGPAVYVDDEFERYEKGEVAVFTTRQYVDADRAGVTGYFGHHVELPVCVLLAAADAIRAGEVPKDGEEAEE